MASITISTAYYFEDGITTKMCPVFKPKAYKLGRVDHRKMWLMASYLSNEDVLLTANKYGLSTKKVVNILYGYDNSAIYPKVYRELLRRAFKRAKDLHLLTEELANFPFDTYRRVQGRLDELAKFFADQHIDKGDIESEVEWMLPHDGSEEPHLYILQPKKVLDVSLARLDRTTGKWVPKVLTDNQIHDLRKRNAKQGRPTYYISRGDYGGHDYELKRLYEWVKDDNRTPAIDTFAVGPFRNIARLIEQKIR